MIRRSKPVARSSKPLKRLTRPRRRRQGRRAGLGRVADRLWSLIVRRRGSCEGCGERQFLQAAHGFSRRYRGTRWLPINGFCLCRKCHMRWTHDPLGWTAWLKAAWGLDVYDELERQARTIAKPDHAAIIAKLREEYGND